MISKLKKVGPQIGFDIEVIESYDTNALPMEGYIELIIRQDDRILSSLRTTHKEIKDNSDISKLRDEFEEEILQFLLSFIE